MGSSPLFITTDYDERALKTSPPDKCNHTHVADELLSLLEEIDPFCILAGGIPRDWALGRTPKDLDLYLHVPNHWQSYVFKSTLENVVGLKVTSLYEKGINIRDSEGIYKSMEHLHSLYEVEFKGVKCQFMRMNTPTFTSVVPCMGSSVCMAWYKRGVINFTKEFRKSHHHKVLAVKDNYTAKVAHISKMKEYFPDYTVVQFKDFNKMFLK